MARPALNTSCIDPSWLQFNATSNVFAISDWQSAKQFHSPSSSQNDFTSSTNIDVTVSTQLMNPPVPAQTSQYGTLLSQRGSDTSAAFSSSGNCSPNGATGSSLSSYLSNDSTPGSSTIASLPTPTTPSTEKSFICEQEGCSRQFGSFKDLKRHFDSLHGASFFRCRCGKKDARKDNHKRHFTKCRLPTSGSSTGRFCCRCGQKSESFDAHLIHIASWNMRSGCHY